MNSCNYFCLVVNLPLHNIRSEKSADQIGPGGTTKMRMLEILIGVILLGGAAWTTVRTYKGRGTKSFLILAFAIFLVALGLFFLFGAFGALFRDFRFGSDWIR